MSPKFFKVFHIVLPNAVTITRYFELLKFSRNCLQFLS